MSCPELLHCKKKLVRDCTNIGLFQLPPLFEKFIGHFCGVIVTWMHRHNWCILSPNSGCSWRIPVFRCNPKPVFFTVYFLNTLQATSVWRLLVTQKFQPWLSNGAYFECSKLSEAVVYEEIFELLSCYDDDNIIQEKAFGQQ